MVSSQLEAFLESMAAECDEKALRTIKANEIFYPVGCGLCLNTVALLLHNHDKNCR